MPQNFKYQTAPMEHQLKAFALSAEAEAFALLMEQGTGKTKVTIDTAAFNYNLGRIDTLIVIAPNGVHRNWVRNEIPKHMPTYIDCRSAWWSNQPSKAERQAIDAVMQPGRFLRVLTFNIESLTVERAYDHIKKMLTYLNVMLVIDESQKIKNPTSKRTQRILTLSKYAKMRRILTGTPVTQSPLDVFSQYTFLDKDILTTQSFTAFRARYAEIMSQDSPLIQAIRRKTGKAFGPVMIATDHDGHPIYKNLDELKALTAPYSFRVMKKDCLDLPDKIYKRRAVELHDTQKKHINELRRRIKEGLLEGQEVTSPVTKLTAVMYYQQILCGILPAALSSTGQSVELFSPGNNPRINTLLDEIEETDEAAIVWCRFTYDVLAVSAALRKVYGDDAVVTYYGAVSSADRDAAVDAMQSGRARFFVGNPDAGGTGITLTAATQTHYYSNSFKLESRLQSEDRNHRIGSTNRVLYVDYEVEGSIDSRIITALRDKKDVADLITGDDISNWMGT